VYGGWGKRQFGPRKRGGPIVRGSGGVFIFVFYFIFFLKIKKIKNKNKKRRLTNEKEKIRKDRISQRMRTKRQSVKHTPETNRRKEEKGVQGSDNKRRKQKSREKKTS
jgi:hypothetical protein